MKAKIRVSKTRVLNILILSLALLTTSLLASSLKPSLVRMDQSQLDYYEPLMFKEYSDKYTAPKKNKLVHTPLRPGGFPLRPGGYGGQVGGQASVVGMVKSLSKMSVNGLKNVVKFGYGNYDKILSKKFAAALIILGAPYLYFSDTNVLETLSKTAADFVFKMSGSISDGILHAVVNNPKALSKIVAALTISHAGQTIVEIVGKKLAGALITVISLGVIS